MLLVKIFIANIYVKPIKFILMLTSLFYSFKIFLQF